MKNLLEKIRGIKKQTVIKNSFLLPILLVVFISISHVVSWYDLGNPLSWAIYLSVAVEVFALASVAAAGLNISRASIWALFGLVTSIQIIGNIFFIFQDINVNSTAFLAWIELVQPWFEDWDVTDHRRLLSYIQGGTLPMMSLIALHYFIKFNDIEKAQKLEEKKKSGNNTPIIKTKPFPKEVLEKIYNDHSNVDPEIMQQMAEGMSGPTSHSGEDGKAGADGINYNDKELFQPEQWFTTEGPIGSNGPDDSGLAGTQDIIENQEEKTEEITEENKIEVLEKGVEALKEAQTLTETKQDEADENVIVEKITKTPNPTIDSTPQSQWAGGSKKGFQNPQAMPGIN